MSKKNIFIAAHYLEIGGAESALIGLLHAIDYEQYNVDLFVYAHRGELMQYIPKQVNLLPEIREYAQIERPIKDVIKSGFLKIAYKRLKAKYLYKKWGKTSDFTAQSAYYQYLANELTPTLPSLHSFGKYDLAVNFIGLNNIINEKVNADVKVGWIHTDYSKILVNKELELPTWDKYDKIVSISDDVRKAFCSVFPQLTNKIVDIENIIPCGIIKDKVNQIGEGIKKSGNSCVFLTIGRYSYPKKMEEIPDICRGLLNVGHNIVWYIIGYGLPQEEKKIKDSIVRNKVENNVILLGKKANPYPYIASCDWYVQPSRYEGKSITVREAQILCKPAIITNYPTASSQISNRVDGVIVPMELEQCVNAISETIKDCKLKDTIAKNLANLDFSGADQIHKFYQLLDK